MKHLKFLDLIGFILIALLLVVACEERNANPPEITGNWQLKEFYSVMYGGYNPVPDTNQRIMVFKPDKTRIIYDYQWEFVAKCNYRLTDSTIVFYGEDYEFSHYYEIQEDSLIIRYGSLETMHKLYRRIRSRIQTAD